MKKILGIAIVCLVFASDHGARGQSIDVLRRASAIGNRLAPTEHAQLPGHPSLYWLVPETRPSRGASASRETARERFARGVTLFGEGKYADALARVTTANLNATPLAAYALYYRGLSEIQLQRYEAAEATFKAIEEREPAGYLSEAVALRRAEVEVVREDPAAAARRLEKLASRAKTGLEDVLLRLARAAEASGDLDKATAAYRRVYFEFPTSAEADTAGTELQRLETPAPTTPERFQLELGRAERLFGSRRYSAARDAFAGLTAQASGDDKELVALRLAESDYYLRRYRAARQALQPYLEDSRRQAEARFFHLTATRALGERDAYERLARGLVADFPKDTWAEETLNNLASHYIIENEDAEADRVFREMYERFPNGRHAERAAWKIGWWAYKSGEFAEAARVFEEAAVAMPRADWRPAWLYWAGRSHDQLGQRDLAVERHRLVASDYLNSYYGRLATKLLEARRQGPITPIVTAANVSSPPEALVPTDALIRELIGLELYDDALRELQYAQRVWGDSPAIQATFGWIYHQKGELRRGINAMKRAYPQYIASGGEDLPPQLLRVLFPVDYWPLIKKYADAHKLDPYLIAALVAQESTFVADIKSPANAIGLMQVVPGTGRRYARKLGIRPFSTHTLTRPEPNVRIGTKYFRELVDRFGGAHFALASYNAGEHRIARWIAERPGISQDEFIDDIPFPETQNYVKKILGTAEDYRRLYGGGLLKPSRLD